MPSLWGMPKARETDHFGRPHTWPGSSSTLVFAIGFGRINGFVAMAKLLQGSSREHRDSLNQMHLDHRRIIRKIRGSPHDVVDSSPKSRSSTIVVCPLPSTSPPSINLHLRFSGGTIWYAALIIGSSETLSLALWYC